MLRVWFKTGQAVVASAMIAMSPPLAHAGDGCGASGVWFDPGKGAAQDNARLIEDMARRQVVLLGEVHDQEEQHRWQLHTLATLHGRQPAMAIGLEMLPRAAQPVLDDWVAGRLSVDDLLARSRWDEVWGFDPDMYLPVFHFARQNRIPMIALNVERDLIARVGTEGWAAVPVGDREGVGEAAPAATSYLDSLARVYVVKARMGRGEDHGNFNVFRAPDETERQALDADPGFQHFVEAQLTWDRAMAEAIAERLAADDPTVRMVVALVGRGHAEFGHGIPHQLADLGIAETGVLLTSASSCDGVEAGVADAVFGLGDWQAPSVQGPRLGVMIAPGEVGIVIQQVSTESVAEATGLAAGDVIVEAAGTPVSETTELISIVQRQAPGTWLPLVVQRESQRIDMVAKFPTTF